MAATCSLSRCISLPVLVFLDFCVVERGYEVSKAVQGAVLFSLRRQSRWQPPGRALLGRLRDRPAGRLRAWGPIQGNEAAKATGKVGLGLRDAVWAYLGGQLLLGGLAGLVALVSTGHGWCLVRSRRRICLSISRMPCLCDVRGLCGSGVWSWI